MLTVCNYHYIREKYNAKYPSIFGVVPGEFKKQILLLRNEGDFIQPNEMIRNLNAVLESKDNYFLITFDDGLKEQFDYAIPILDELEIPAVFFANSINFENKKVSTVHKIHLLRSIIKPRSFLNIIKNSKIVNFSESEKNKAQIIYRYDDLQGAELKYLLNFKLSFKQQEKVIGELFDDHFEESTVLRELYMDTENILILAQRGYLGSHTHSHYPIGLLNMDDVKFKLENSKSYFEKLTNSKIEMVAYPYGTREACTDEVAVIAKTVGYKVGFTTKRGSNEDGVNHLLLNRFDCNDLVGGKNYTYGKL